MRKDRLQMSNLKCLYLCEERANIKSRQYTQNKLINQYLWSQGRSEILQAVGVNGGITKQAQTEIVE